MALFGLGGAGAGNLGTLFISLTANPAGMIAGMKAATKSVVAGSASILAATKAMAVGVTGALAAIALAGVVQFGQFEKAMVKSTAIMTDVTAGLRSEMEKTARLIATESITSAEKLAEGYFFLASAGLSAEQSIKALNVVNTFAIAGAFDMALATDLLTDAQSALGLTVKDTTQNMINMTRISDVLVKANTLANATVEQFSTALTREAGAAMKSFNIDVEEGVAVLAAFADQGVKAELAGTSLSRILRLMTSAAVKNAEAYKEMGIEVFDSSGNLRNMGDIVADLEGALGGLSDQSRTVALDTLGFKARVQGVILPLLGTSNAIKEYEKNLRSAGGTTQDVADKQMKSFFAQLTITWNRIKDILFTIGDQLTPALRILNEALSESVGNSTELNKSFGTFASNIGPAFITIIGLIGDGIHGWNLIIDALQLAFSKVVLWVSEAFTKVLRVISLGISKVLTMFNKLQQTLREAFPESASLFGSGLSTAGVTNSLRAMNEDAEAATQVLREVVASNQKDLRDEVDKGLFSERLLEKYKKATSGIEDESEKLKKSIEGLVNDVKKKFDELGDSFNRGGLFGKGGIFGAGMSDKERVQQELVTGTINQEHSNIFGPTGGDQANLGFGASQNIGAEGQLGLDLEREKEELQARMDVLTTQADLEVELTQETEDRKLAVLKAMNEEMMALQMAQSRVVLQGAQSTFDSLAQSTEMLAGKQSGIYKVMFAASKAFAIADATVSIAQGIAKAASLGFPLGIIGIAQVVAATTSIISSIQSTQLAFGGAREKGGPVTPGKAFLVGEKGPELFSPGASGMITPNNKMGGGGKVSVVVNNFGNAQAEVKESQSGDDRKIEVIIDKTKKSIAADINAGTGDVPKTLQSTFGLQRRGT